MTLRAAGVGVGVLMLSGCATDAPTPAYPQRLTLVAFDGCPNAPILEDRLVRAMSQEGWGAEIMTVDPTELPANDPRARFASPTILVNDHDLFGLPPSPTSAPQCRVYQEGLPSVERIARSLREEARR